MLTNDGRCTLEIKSQIGAKYNSLSPSPGIELASFVFTNDTMVWASLRHTAEEAVPNLRHMNGFIGAYVTAGARNNLYGSLDGLKQNPVS